MSSGAFSTIGEVPCTISMRPYVLLGSLMKSFSWSLSILNFILPVDCGLPLTRPLPGGERGRVRGFRNRHSEIRITFIKAVRIFLHLFSPSRNGRPSGPPESQGARHNARHKNEAKPHGLLRPPPEEKNGYPFQ